jgi:TRAP-type C4-dicarboxylate transport system permease small subunit
MCAVTFAQAAGRYVFHFSFVWSEELSRYLMVWISMLGGAVAARRRMHFGFESLVAALPAALGRTARVAATLLAIVTFGYLGWYGFKLAHFNMLQVSPALEWPMGVPYAAVPVGAALIVLFLVESLASDR